MAKEKKSFVLYQEQEEVINRLSDEQAGKIYKAIFEYNRTGETPKMEQLLDFIFIPIKQSIDRNKDKWVETCQRRSEAGKLGGLAKASKSSKSKQTLANLADSDNENDIDSEPDIDNDILHTHTEKDPLENYQIYGEHSRVYLTKEDLNKLECYQAIGKKKAQELIKLLERRIETGKEKDLCITGHYARMQQLFDYEKSNPHRFKSNKIDVNEIDFS